jgi:hypothetical protein
MPRYTFWGLTLLTIFVLAPLAGAFACGGMESKEAAAPLTTATDQQSSPPLPISTPPKGG